MPALVFWGIFSIGFIFGFLLYYAVRHTQEFNVEMLSIAVGAVGGAVVIGLLGNYQDWIAPYGLGLIAGFAFYFILSVILVAAGVFNKLGDVGILSKTPPGLTKQ